jgi:rare lipoprotein A
MTHLRLIYHLSVAEIQLTTRKWSMKTVSIRTAVLCAAAWALGCGQAAAGCGVASTLSTGKQAQGEAGGQAAMTAAHQSLPPGTRVIVRNQKKGKSIIVEIAERAPLVGPIIELAAGAVDALGLEPADPVCLEVISYGSKRPGYQKFAMRSPAPPAPKPAVAVAAAPKPVAAPAGHVLVRAHYAKARAGAKHYAKLHRRTQ